MTGPGGEKDAMKEKKRSVKSGKTAVMHNKSQTTKPGGGRANLESNL